jgi:hypothetical protein
MTIAFNLSQLANYVNSSGKLDAANGLVNATPVANGGTGAATATAYAVQCGGTTSTGAYQSIASVGTTGQVLTSNGAAALPTFQTAAAGGFSNIAVFTSSGSWTVPSGITKAKVTVVGGGGGGGYTYNYENNGGGGGGTAMEYVTGLSGTISITVGSGGARGNPGTTGGTSSFGSYCSASGGLGGSSRQDSDAPLIYPGVGGSGSGGSINISGGGGTLFQYQDGGTSSMSAGNGKLYGGGGNLEDVGAAGIVIIEY